jgi:tellurite resistance protein TerC
MDFFSQVFLGWPVPIWLGFLAIVMALLALDLGILHRKAHAPGVRESLLMSAFYVTLGLSFSAIIYFLYFQSAPPGGLDPALAIADDSERAARAAQLYLTGFIVEWSLSLDNIFVMSLIFTYFAIPRERQHRVLFWGILGVVILRASLIFVGAALVAEFHWVLYFFAAFLVWTGIMMLRKGGEDDPHIADNKAIAFLRRHMRVTDKLHDGKFWVRQPHPKTGKLALYATPLLLALMVVEFADLIFALDSVPAIFAITTDPFIVYTSNIFAILGLRTLYFSLAALIHRFAYLKYALSATLIFIGAKIFIGEFMPGGKVPPEWSLIVIISFLSSGILYSLWKTRKDRVTVS